MKQNTLIQWDDLYQSFTTQLNDLILAKPETMALAQEAVDIAISHLHTLKELIISHEFANQEEEVKFFKQYKPKFHCQLIYYSKIFNIELKKPIAGKAALEEYLHRQLLRIKMFYENHMDLYQYYRSKATYLDDKYFVRGHSANQRMIHHRHPDVDPRFTTDKDYVFSQIMASEMLSQYLQQSLDTLYHTVSPPTLSPVAAKPFIWTDSKTDFVEFIYGLKVKGCINNGNVTLKELFDRFSPFFSITVSNSSRVFQEILSRKKSSLNWYNKTGNGLKDAIDNMDD